MNEQLKPIEKLDPRPDNLDVVDSINDIDYVFALNEAAYRNLEPHLSSVFTTDHFVAFHDGQLVAHNSDKSKLYHMVFNLQETRGKFRSYIVKVEPRKEN